MSKLEDLTWKQDRTTTSKLCHHRHGIYEILYEDAPLGLPYWTRLFCILHNTSPVAAHTTTLLKEIFALEPFTLTAYILSAGWGGISSAINIYFITVLFNLAEGSFANGAVEPRTYRLVALLWLVCTLTSVTFNRIHATSRDLLCTRLRAHFLPQLIGASLRADVFSMQDVYKSFPITSRFGSEFPCESFLTQLARMVHSVLALVSEPAVLIYIISCKQDLEREFFVSISVIHILSRWLAPASRIGSSYIFWTDNPSFNKMKVLFGLAFTPQYRADLVLDGLANSIEPEYRKSTQELGGLMDFEPHPWSGALLRHWIWDILINVAIDLPLAAYALTLPGQLSLSSIASIALVQRITGHIFISIGKCKNDPPSLNGLELYAKWLYEAINYKSSMPHGFKPYPDPGSSGNGMKVSSRGVHFRYPEGRRDALCGVSLDIQPGQLILVVGENGSGKSSLLKLFTRLCDPSYGDILVDDQPLGGYNPDQLREAICFLSQSATVYPGSVRENITLGLLSMQGVSDKDMEEAARKAGCSPWISVLSNCYDTQLQPSFDITLGWQEGVYGFPSAHLNQELQKRMTVKVSISAGQRQRLAVARAFMRLKNKDTKLLLFDEATSMLDPVTERDILLELQRSCHGKTMVFVTHRFRQLAGNANQILCMKDGSIVERGTHEALLTLNGEYARLFNAQAT